MKNLIIILALCLNFISQAQDFRLTSITGTFGKGSVFSGSDLKFEFTNTAGESFAVTANHTRMHVGYNWKAPVLGIGLNLAASGGFNKNAPWLGPKIGLVIGQHISTLHWLAIAAGKQEKPSFDIQMMFGFNAVYVKVWSFQLSYALLHWMENSPEHIPGLFYGNGLGDKWSYSVGAEYNLNKEEPLFQFVLKKSF